MAAEFDGIQVLRVVAVPDTRPGHTAPVALGILFLVDGQGPFGFELTEDLQHPVAVVRAIQARAREIRSLLLF